MSGAVSAPPDLTDFEVAERIRDRELPSPQRYGNFWLFDLRITGTGAAYRPSYGEYAVRDPEKWLTDEMVERCNGLTVTFVHPKKDALDTQEYRERAIGSVVLPYKTDDELRGVAKIFDDDAAMMMRSGFRSTSPGVQPRANTAPISLPDGTPVLDEDTPLVFDHVAICQEGVWDKNDLPSGVRLDAKVPPRDPSMVHAAGVAMLCPVRSNVFLVQRGAGQDHAGEWAFPGGHVERNETEHDAAEREFSEEVGAHYHAPLQPLTRTVADFGGGPVDFTTFRSTAESAFDPHLSDESADGRWFALDDLPENIHPGCAEPLRILVSEFRNRARKDSRDETRMNRADVKSFKPGDYVTWGYRGTTGHGEVKKRVKSGETPDKDEYEIEEFDHHPGEKKTVRHYASDMEHSTKSDVESASKKVRARDDETENEREPYGDVKYADPGYQDDHEKRYPIDTKEHIRAAWEYIHHHRDEDKYSARERKEIEDRIIAAWKDKIDPSGPPEAESKKDASMADKSDDDRSRNDESEEEKLRHECDEIKKRIEDDKKKLADVEAKMRGDASDDDDEDRVDAKARKDETEEEKRALKAANEAREKNDASDDDHEHEGRKDAYEKRVKDGRFDETKKERSSNTAKEDRERDDARERGTHGRSDEEEVEDDPLHKFEREGEDEGERDEKHGSDRAAGERDVDADPPKMTDKPIADSRVRELENMVNALRGQVSRMSYQPSIDDRNKLAEAHHRADSLYQMLGADAPRPLPGELSSSYRRRAVSGLRRFTTSYRKYVIADSADDTTFGLLEREIYKEAEANALAPAKPVPGVLREVRTTENGKQVSRFYGDSRTTWAPFIPPTITRIAFNHERLIRAQSGR